MIRVIHKEIKKCTTAGEDITRCNYCWVKPWESGRYFEPGVRCLHPDVKSFDVDMKSETYKTTGFPEECPLTIKED